MIQRNGEVVIQMLPNVQQVTIQPVITETVAPGTMIYTDEYDIYTRLPQWGYQHKSVNHGAGEYAHDEDGDGFHWNQTHDRHHNPIINVTFSAPACWACPHHARCTTSAGPRHITIRPKEQHEELQAARQRQESTDFQEKYAIRAGIEGTFTQAIRLTNLRRSRYIGQAKTHLHHLLAATALNLRPIFAWFQGDPLAHTRSDPFVDLFPA